MGTIRALFKFVFTAIGLLLIGIAVLLVVFAARIEGLIQQQLERRMSAILGADATVEGLKWAPWQGRFALVGLRIQNPGDFPPEPLLYATQVTMHIDVPTIFSDAPRISSILVEGGEIHLRYSTGLGVNLAALGRNALNYSRIEDNRSGRKIKVGEIRWDEAFLRFSPGPPVPITVPPYTIDGIGDGQGGVLPAEMMSAVFYSMLRRTAGLPGLPGPMAAVLRVVLDEKEELDDSALEEAPSGEATPGWRLFR